MHLNGPVVEVPYRSYWSNSWHTYKTNEDMPDMSRIGRVIALHDSAFVPNGCRETN